LKTQKIKHSHAQQPESDRRHGWRLASETPFMVQDSVHRQPFGVLGNVSVGGMLVISEHLGTAGAIHQFETLDRKGNTAFSGFARCIWCAPTRRQGQFWLGMSFLHMSAAQRRQLAKVLAQTLRPHKN